MTAHLAAIALAVAVAPPVNPAEDDLPPGVVRLGVGVLRSAHAAIRFHDAQTLVSVAPGGVMTVRDAAAGRLRERRRPATAGFPPHARTEFTAGGNVVAVRGELWRFFSVPGGEPLPIDVPGDAAVTPAVSADMRTVVFARQTSAREHAPAGNFVLPPVERRYAVEARDARGGPARPLLVDVRDVERIELSPDGRSVAVAAADGVRLIDAPTGRVRAVLRPDRVQGMSFTADSRRLVTGGFHAPDRWLCFDVADGSPSAGWVAPPVGYAWSFEMSRDGRYLFVPTHTDYVVCDTVSGGVVRSVPGAAQAGRGAFAPDGRSFVTSDTVLRRFDLATGKAKYSDTSRQGHVSPVTWLAWTPDGKRLVSVAREDVRIWDVSSRKATRFALGDFVPLHWAISPDGSTLAGIDATLGVLRWSVRETKALDRFALKELRDLDLRMSPLRLGFTTEGDALAVLATPALAEYSMFGVLHSWWDAKTGRHRAYGRHPGNDFRVSLATTSHDGRFTLTDGALRDAASGEVLRRDDAHGEFTADGRYIVGVGKEYVTVTEVASGETVGRVKSADARRVAVSADARRVAVSFGNALEVHDLATKTLVWRKAVPGAGDRDGWWVSLLAFSPDGSRLATAGTDGIVLLWDVPPPVVVGAAAREPLAGTAAEAHAAMWAMRADPAATLRDLSRKFPLAGAVTEERGRALVAKLDADTRAEREAAYAELGSMGGRARGFLESVKTPTAEQRKRIAELLRAIDLPALPVRGERATVRAVAVVEWIATAEARALLRTWRDRAKDPRLADESRRALLRIGDE